MLKISSRSARAFFISYENRKRQIKRPYEKPGREHLLRLKPPLQVVVPKKAEALRAYSGVNLCDPTVKFTPTYAYRATDLLRCMQRIHFSKNLELLDVPQVHLYRPV